MQANESRRRLVPARLGLSRGASLQRGDPQHKPETGLSKRKDGQQKMCSLETTMTRRLLKTRRYPFAAYRQQ